MASSDEILSSLKLLVDTKSNKVLFAEADNEFVNFLFGLVTIPIGVVSKLCSTRGTMHGSFSRIYDSVDNIDDPYLEPNIDKSDLLDPIMTALGREYVKEPETYIVTDGLEVTPMSAISILALVSRFIPDMDVELAEKIVYVYEHEILALLTAAMRSDTVLTDVFVARKK